MDYEKMLDDGIEKLPESVLNKTRFEIPKVVGHIQGNKTIISNFQQIVSSLNRPADHFLKYLLKEIATPGELASAGLIVGTKISAKRINEKVRKYADEFVLCKTCGKPDTKIEKEGGFTYLKCTACGTKYPVKSKI